MKRSHGHPASATTSNPLLGHHRVTLRDGRFADRCRPSRETGGERTGHDLRHGREAPADRSAAGRRHGQGCHIPLAGVRGLGTYVRATTWLRPQGKNLIGSNVVIIGAGGITESLLRLLAPFTCEVTVVRRRAAALSGAARILTLDHLDDAIAAADVAVLALALTPQSEGLIDRRRLDLLGERGWLVNVARGRHVVTDDLVAALKEGTIGGAALDVTDPEPLPHDHPLWTFPNGSSHRTSGALQRWRDLSSSIG